MKKKTKLLKMSCLLMLSVGFSAQSIAQLSYNIPPAALTRNGQKVKICHLPEGAQQYTKVKISVGALGSYINNPNDVFRTGRDCPAVEIPSMWEYFGSFNSSTGKPNNTTSSCTVPEGTLDKVYALLPEGQAVPADSPMLVGDSQANILLQADANIDVAVVVEVAGYKNSLGFFSFDKTDLSSLTTDLIVEKILFPNYSMAGSGGDLSTGDTIELGEFTSGTGIGFTVVANGWSGSAVREDRTNKQIFRTVKGMNPEQAGPENRNYHTVLLSDPENEVLILAIEDLNRESSSHNDWGITTDNDFNDAIIAICVDPFDAIEEVENIINIETGTVPPPSQTEQGVTGRLNWSEKTVPPVMQNLEGQGGGGVTPY